MRNRALARLLAVVVLAFALWAGVRMTTRGNTKSDKMPELSDADKEKFAREREYFKLHGSEDLPLSIAAEDKSQRYDPLGVNIHDNVVRGWPSVGGIIIAERVHPVELEYLQLDRFQKTPRSLDAAEEDEFCRRLRLVGGKWWESDFDFEYARLFKMRRVYPDEKEVLYLGWPKDGGVWVLRYRGEAEVGDAINSGIPLGIIYNALTMEERCKAIQMIGGAYFAKPEDSEFVRPLVGGFGDHVRRTISEFGDGELPE